MQERPVVSVIVPVWNGEATIEDTIRSLLQQSYPAAAVQIIVVDNGSTDRTAEIIGRYPEVTLLREEKPGSYAARNTGLKIATGTYVAFTDADCMAHAAWLSSAIPLIEGDAQTGIVAGRIEVIPSEGGSQRAYLIEKELSFKQHEAVKRGTCVTANWVSRTSVIRDAGGFDERVKSGGDYLLSSRLSGQGLRIVYAENAVVYHPSRGDVSELLRKRRRVAGGAWARKDKSLYRLIRAEIAGCLRRLSAMARAPGLRLGQKISVMPLVVLMATTSISELLRLSMGGDPRRA
ncbi:glycosyltransferase [Croceibacterium sp. TMG7-5b_MA50]|uniref:glycosyltransferase n=1 Tax=Croceibacterium sp. TMG7-5b_MA50 TaxID=3121290 RepID=UPI003221C8E3